MAFEIQLAGAELVWPNLCVCCGAPPETELIWWMKERRTRIGADFEVTTTWKMPACKRCHAHMVFMGKSGAMQYVINMTLQLFGIVYFLVIRPLKRRIARRWRGPSCSRSLEKPRCWLNSSTSDTFFSFESPTVARAFAEANRPRLVDPSPALQALLSAVEPTSA